MNIHESIKTDAHKIMDICIPQISIGECPCMDIPAWILMWISTPQWIIEDLHPKAWISI